MKLVRALFSLAVVASLAGCGATSANSPAPAVSSVPAAAGDLANAKHAALGLIVADASGPQGHWGPCSQLKGWAGCPLSTNVTARLDALASLGYFSGGTGCAEEYITHSQNGLNSGPKALSAVAGAGGKVTVVIQRGPGAPDLTAVMTLENGSWLASDLASGGGSSASIFSARPNC